MSIFTNKHAEELSAHCLKTKQKSPGSSLFAVHNYGSEVCTSDTVSSVSADWLAGSIALAVCPIFSYSSTAPGSHTSRYPASLQCCETHPS
ncbi:hypothetical protein AOXY_G24962 [Acipenser oxyrinchus oxyrinchus]|uniref:Uncharacterized protein n=1 Tax=Acipenser oxyrinchus oxyrinchus TaxID=40147 RepID=A0AAD8FXZ2_ACIOX|nr:hypothetical protein AOXY_G24962 [Acipenser oxyrinchus oxyrinchus]